MTDYTQAIDEFVRDYLESCQKSIGSSMPPLSESRTALESLTELLTSSEYYYNINRRDGFVRQNSDDDSLDYLFVEKNQITHVRFKDSDELLKYIQLQERMTFLAGQEAEEKAYSEALRSTSTWPTDGTAPVIGFFLGVFSYFAAISFFPELKEGYSNTAVAVGALFSVMIGAVGCEYLHHRLICHYQKRGLNEKEETAKQLRTEHNCLFQEFRDTFSARFIHGRQALEAALEE